MDIIQWCIGGKKDYVSICLENKTKCPQLIFEYVWKELIIRIAGSMAANSAAQYIFFALMILFTIYIVRRYLYGRYNGVNTSENERFSKLNAYEQMKALLDLLKGEIDEGHRVYLKNVYARYWNAMNEIALLRKRLIKFIRIGADPLEVNFVVVDSDELEVEVVQFKKLKYTEVSPSAKGHLKSINKCYASMNLLIEAKHRYMTSYFRILYRVLVSAQKILFGNYQGDQGIVKINNGIIELNKHIRRAIALVSDEHCSLMNSTPENIYTNIRIMEDNDINLSEKLRLILNTICDWINLLDNIYVQERRYKDFACYNSVRPAVRKLEARLSEEKNVLVMLKQIVREVEYRHGVIKHIPAHKMIESTYIKIVEILHGQTGADYFSATRNSEVVRPKKTPIKAKSDTGQFCRSKDPEFLNEVKQPAESSSLQDVKKLFDHFLKEGIQKTLELKTILSSVENLALKDKDLDLRMETCEHRETGALTTRSEPIISQSVHRNRGLFTKTTMTRCLSCIGLNVGKQNIPSSEIAFLPEYSDNRKKYGTHVLSEQLMQGDDAQLVMEDSLRPVPATASGEQENPINEQMTPDLSRVSIPRSSAPVRRMRESLSSLKSIAEESEPEWFGNTTSEESIASRRSAETVIFDFMPEFHEINAAESTSSIRSNVQEPAEYKSIEEESEPEWLGVTTSEESIQSE